MFEKTRTLTKVLYCFTSTSKTEDEVIRKAVKRTYLNHEQLKRSLGSSMPSIEKMARKVLGEVVFTQETLSLTRIKREFLPLAIRAYGEFVNEIESSKTLKTGAL